MNVVGKFTQWHFRIRTTAAERMSSRILQILEIQRAEPSEFQFKLLTGAMHITFLLVTDGPKANRIGLLIRRSERVSSAVWTPLKEHGTLKDTDQIALSLKSLEEHEPDNNPESSFWRAAPSICMQADAFGRSVEGHATEVRLRWTEQNLYFLFICSYAELHLPPAPPMLGTPTAALWEWDVAEVFVGEDRNHLSRYCEFEISPRGEWLDLQIECVLGSKVNSTALNSGFSVSALVDITSNQWFGFARVPYRAIVSGRAAAGDRLKINFFRSQGRKPTEIAWQPPYSDTFHVPSIFGELLLVD